MAADSSAAEAGSTKHVRISDKPCPHCGKLFYRASHLDAHIRSHTGEVHLHPCCLLVLLIVCFRQKPFKCDIDGCDKAFKRKDQLTRHMRSHITDKSFLCDYENCHKAFATDAHLRRHKKTHISLERYTCDICHMSFHKKTQLRAHNISDHGIAEFQCQEGTLKRLR